MKKMFLCLAVCALVTPLTGCSSIAKGVTEAIMEKKDKAEDTRLCEIAGPAFEGIEASVAHKAVAGAPGTTKVLMVHGISKHLPGYSARFREKLAASLGLDSMDPTIKNITLTNAVENGEDVGTLRVSRHFSSANDREFLFYELTWSGIGEMDKEVIAFDDSEAYNYRRAGLNKSLKKFMNATVPDLLVYEGLKKGLIDKSVGQSVCWAFRGSWDNMPDNGRHYCNAYDNSIATNIKQDDFYIVTHSLGSRITIDTLNRFAADRENCEECKKLDGLNATLQNETITVFMMANQLPLLQVGQEKSGTTGVTDEYCQPGGSHYSERLVGKVRIVAFSDPNDILSYPIPPDYADAYIDSRYCPEIVNIDLNIAHPKDLLGVTEFANPLEAHVGYQDDDRVIALMTSGLNRNHMHPLIAEKCNWTEYAIKQKK